jgi:hypothetical protein
LNLLLVDPAICMMSEKNERTPEKFISAFFLCSVGNSRFTTYLSRYIPQIETCTLKDALIKRKKTLPLINWKSSGAVFFRYL